MNSNLPRGWSGQRRRPAALVLFLLALPANAVLLSAQAAGNQPDLSALLIQADALDKLENHVAVMALLQPAVARTTDARDLSAIHWRLARAGLAYGDQQKDAGASRNELLEIFETAEGHADRTIELDPENPLGYFWKSSNIGRWGQTRGVLDSLAKAPTMRDLLSRAVDIDPDHGDSYYVLGQLYAAVPGLISFGNRDYAVSLSRRSIDIDRREVAAGTREQSRLIYYLKLADHLAQRNWSQRRREQEQQTKRRNWERATTSLQRGWYFEGQITIPGMSDRDEARLVLDDLIRRLLAKTDRLPSENRTLREAQELRADI